MKFHLAVGISLLLHFALGAVLIVSQKIVNRETIEPFVLAQPQSIVVNLQTPFSTLDHDVTTQSKSTDTVKTKKRQQSNNNHIEKEQPLTTSNPSIPKSVPSKGSPAAENLVSAHLASPQLKEAEPSLSDRPIQQSPTQKSLEQNVLHANSSSKTARNTTHDSHLIASEYTLQDLTIVTNPVYLKWRKPVYPRQSIAKNQEGKVLVDVRVNNWGRVISLEVHKSSGYPLLDRAAIKSVKHWIFEPARQHGMKVNTVVRVPVSFVIAQK